MEEISNIVANYGIGVACILYFMYFNSTTLRALTSTLSEVKESLILLNEKVSNLEEKYNKSKKSGE